VAAGLRDVTDTAGPDFKATMERVRNVAENLASTTSRLDKVIAENQQDIRSFARDSLPQLESLLRDSRSAAQEFSALARSLRENPSRIVYEPPATGVEIPR
jgi:ABC-type transporter Mla subunit MlaD